MNLRTVILAFLSARYPGAYSAKTIAQRVSKSGLVDAQATEDQASAELVLLSSKRLGELVRCDADPLTGSVVWSSTVAGVEAWSRDGRIHVE